MHKRLPIALATLLCLAACHTGGPAERGDDKRKRPGAESEPPIERVAFGSCAKQDRPQPIWAEIADADPDLFLFIGDNVYGDVTSQEDPAMPELASAYAAQAKVEGFVKLRESVPILPIWDDHDYGKNDGGADFALRGQAERLFLDFWKIGPDDPRSRRPGLYHAKVFGPPGRRVQVILLDTRTFRAALTEAKVRGPGRERYEPEPDPTRTMLGEAQWAWLRQQFETPAEVRLLVSSIQIIAEGHGYERWGNLPTERQKLFDLIEETKVGGLIALSGDRHLGAIYRHDGGPYPLYEITSSALNSPASGAGAEPGPKRLGEVYTAENFGLIEVDWGRGSLTMSLRDLDGDAVREQTIALMDLPGR